MKLPCMVILSQHGKRTMRDLTPGFIEQLEADVKSIAVFFEAEFASGTIRYWTGYGPIVWDGKTWSGVGTIIQISQITETSDVRADGLLFTLSGISDEIRSIVLQEVRQGKPGSIFIGFIDEFGDVVADPANAFEGRLDVPSVQDGGPTIAVSLSYETRLRDLERVRELRYTNESQQQLHPGDIGFEYVPSLQDWNGVWGRS